MKQYVHMIYLVIICLVCGIVTPASGQTTISTALHYDLIRDDSSPETTGYEMTIPLNITHSWEHLSLSAETAYSTAYIEIDDFDAELSSLIDMLWSASYTSMFPGLPLSLILGLDVNIPTGKEQLDEVESSVELGESNDLFQVDNFGEGLNIGFSLGVMGQIRDFVLALQGAYIWNGEFDPTSDVEDDDIDPGDQLLVLSLLEWQASPVLTFGTFVSYSHFSVDKTEGEEYFRQADQVAIGADLQVVQGPLEGMMSFQSLISGKNEMLEQEVLEEETENSNGTDVSGTVAVTYSVSEKFNVWLDGDVRYYGESDLKDTQSGLPYSGKRIRYAMGSGFNYRLNTAISCNGSITFFTMNQERDVFVEQNLTYQGVNLGIGMSYTL